MIKKGLKPNESDTPKKGVFPHNKKDCFLLLTTEEQLRTP